MISVFEDKPGGRVGIIQVVNSKTAVHPLQTECPPGRCAATRTSWTT